MPRSGKRSRRTLTCLPESNIRDCINMQEPIIFENNGQRIFGTIHVPGGDDRALFSVVVMLHGLMGQRIETHQLFVKAARRFASEGILVLRFDFRGCGESEGSFEELTIKGQISDALAAIRLIRQRRDVRSSSIALLGFSLGGAVAASVAGSGNAGVSCLVLWSAVADFKRAFYSMAQEDLISNFGKREVHDYFGNALSQKFIDELLAFRPAERIRSYKGPALIVHGNNDETITPDDSRLYEKALENRDNVELHVIEGADHTFASLVCERELIDKTSAFLKRHLPCL